MQKANPPANLLQPPSRAAVDEHQLLLQERRAELKRELSELSYEDAPIPYQKLKIEDLDLQRDELKVRKVRLDIEHKQRGLSDNARRKEHREINKRIVNLGSDLWTEQKVIREQEEKAGRKPKLTPDSRGPFVHTLLALYKDLRQSRKRSSHVQTQLKNASIVVYDAAKGATSKDKIWCCISKDYFDKPDVVAGHIVPHSLGPELVDYIFGSGSGSRLESADNCILMHRNVERAFDKGHFVLMPADAREAPVRRWKIQMTHSAAQKADMGKVSLKDLDGKELEFINDNRPASRFLYYHFVVTLLRNKRDRQEGWEKYLTQLPTGQPFATPGRYLRESMLLALSKAAGDLNPAEEVKWLGGQGETFVEEDRISEVEEDKISDRALSAHDEEDEEEDEEGDEEEDEEENDDE